MLISYLSCETFTNSYYKLYILTGYRYRTEGFYHCKIDTKGPLVLGESTPLGVKEIS